MHWAAFNMFNILEVIRIKSDTTTMPRKNKNTSSLQLRRPGDYLYQKPYRKGFYMGLRHYRAESELACHLT